MVLQTERYPGGYQQQSYNAYQGPNGNYSSFQGITTENSPPYSTYPQVSNYPSPHAPQNQFGRPSGDDYYGNGAYPGSGARPTTGGYGSSYYDNSHGSPHGHGHGNPHGHGHGSPHGHSHGSPHGQGHGSQHGYGSGANHFDKPTHGHNGYGGGATNHFDKPTHGHNGYGSGIPNYGYSQSGMNHGYQKPSWILKGLDDEE
ncbi:annexin B11-like [Cynara cardunculus var. scolymus]|uniref:annexin B11-like n=1 Tax=Cynara cardunculus var. scolymus TaxID=59895 RepID=UPI000D625F6D|nr:annexin B11-like [Cynara cardunculus var. scolymus]